MAPMVDQAQLGIDDRQRFAVELLCTGAQQSLIRSVALTMVVDGNLVRDGTDG